MPDARLHATVHGVVQGVGFRFFVLRRAQRLSLTGWVRNVGHDQVETVAEGQKDALNAFIDELKAGPSSSRVKRVDVRWGKPTHEFTGFQVTYQEW